MKILETQEDDQCFWIDFEYFDKIGTLQNSLFYFEHLDVEDYQSRKLLQVTNGHFYHFLSYKDDAQQRPDQLR